MTFPKILLFASGFALALIARDARRDWRCRRKLRRRKNPYQIGRELRAIRAELRTLRETAGLGRHLDLAEQVARWAVDDSPSGLHQFVGSDRWCEVCNKPDRDPAHVQWMRLNHARKVLQEAGYHHASHSDEELIAACSLCVDEGLVSPNAESILARLQDADYRHPTFPGHYYVLYLRSWMSAVWDGEAWTIGQAVTNEKLRFRSFSSPKPKDPQ